MSIILRMDIDHPYGKKSLFRHILSRISSDFYFPRIEALEYLNELKALLTLLNQHNVRSYIFFRQCSHPSPSVLERIDEGQHIIGLHLENSRSFGTFKNELNRFVKKLNRKIDVFSKHGSGKYKYGFRHYAPYEPEKYIDWGTIEDWDRFKRSFATLFIDIDGTIVINSSSHFPPYIGNTDPIQENIEVIKDLYRSGKFQVILTTSRREKYKKITERQMENLGIKYDGLIMGLLHSKRIIINDYSKSNPFKSCDSINLKRDTPELKEILRDSLGVDYNEI